jgi:SAM-dependent methyltransferase
VPDFAAFDRRHYRTVGVPEGYAAWASTYEATVEDAIDLALLDRLETVEWSKVERVADLGCGTGRTARWLRTRGDFRIDGVDVTPAMLGLARANGAHDRLVVADVRATGLESGAYDLVTCGLVDEHLPDLGPLYLEARRLLRPGLGADVVMSGCTRTSSWRSACPLISTTQRASRWRSRRTYICRASTWRPPARPASSPARCTRPSSTTTSSG